MLSYTQFLFVMLYYVHFKEDVEYDQQYQRLNPLFEYYLESSYNNARVNEYTCIEEFFKDVNLDYSDEHRTLVYIVKGGDIILPKNYN
jgi:hypothetical protein